MPELNPSLYEMLLQNFEGEMDLHQVGEEDQLTLSVLDNLQRILNSRAGSIAHLPDYGLPDMGLLMHGLPSAAHGLMDSIADTLLKYEPRLVAVDVKLLPQRATGHLEYSLDVQLGSGKRVSFVTSLGAEGKALVRHLKRQNPV